MAEVANIASAMTALGTYCEGGGRIGIVAEKRGKQW